MAAGRIVVEYERRLCYVHGKKCLFHRWIDRSKGIDASPLQGGHPGGTLRMTFALVEGESGEMFEVFPTDVIFADDICKLAWVTEVHVNETQTEIQERQGGDREATENY